MSLYGTGRKEGIFAACFIGILTAGAHLAALLRNDSMHEAAYVTMFAGAIGGMLAYRFLRAQGRSRYAAFLGGIAYGMSPLFAGLMDSPREQLAAAFAPLTLEAAAQCSRPTTRRRWLPWVGVSLAIPFTFGVTVIAILGSGLALSMVTMTLVHCGRGDERIPLLTTAISLALGATCLLNVAWLDPLGAWLGMHQTADLQRVLSGETTPMVILRAIGPFLVWFALLGILRRQRHIATSLWLPLAVIGALPTIAQAVPSVASNLPATFATWGIPAMSWWLSLLAVTVLGTAGLDDWLDQPQRRRGAHLSLLLLTAFGAPALPLVCSSVHPMHLATVLGTFGILSMLTLVWRRLGVLQLKNVLSAVALTVFALPAILHTLPATTLAAPVGEVAAKTWQRVGEQLLAHPWWHFAGIIGSLVTACILALLYRSQARKDATPTMVTPSR